MSTVGLFVIERMFQVELRDKMFDVRTAVRIIEIDGGAILGG